VERHSSAGVIVFRRGDDGCRFLLLRSKLTRRPIWEFPKGGIDPGESARAAALRELGEETGFDTADVRLIEGFERAEDYHFTSRRKGGERTLVRKRVVYFLAEAMHGDVRISASEASDFAWLPLAEAARRLRYPTRRRMLQDAAAVAGCAGRRLASVRATKAPDAPA
jgi:bis(5'-nucleosidyl)-tetraphosphatase